MPTIKQKTTLAPGTTANPLVGNQYEYLPFNALVEFAILQEPETTAGDVVEATVFSGSDVLMQGSDLDTKALADPIQYPWDYDIQDVAAAGERLGVTLVNKGGTDTLTVRTVVRITPL